jgi:protocatechuate 3,4-dioxygenase beta subunit
MYFADEHEANASDPVLNLIEWEVRRKTLIAGPLDIEKDGFVLALQINVETIDHFRTANLALGD